MSKEQNTLYEDYSDMLDLIHHRSKTHPAMAMEMRAAQFMPFAALTGYEDAVNETARITEEKMELEEDRKAILDEKLRILENHRQEKPQVKILYFEADQKKAGGAYLTVEGIIKKIDPLEHEIVLTNQLRIKIEDIIELNCDLFPI